MIFGFILGLLWRRPRHGRVHLDRWAILFGIWMTPWLLIGGSTHSAWPFWLALLVWIVGWLIARAHNNWQETRES
jgi:hypothetical protein